MSEIVDKYEISEQFAIETDENDKNETEIVTTNDEVEVMAKKIPTIDELEPITVRVKFVSVADEIPVCIISTNQYVSTTAAGKKLRLVSGKMYLIPVDTDIDSDEKYFIKVYSKMADKIDVKYVKNHTALVIPIKNNVVLYDGDIICVVY